MMPKIDLKRHITALCRCCACFSNVFSLFSAFNLCRFINTPTSSVPCALKSVEWKNWHSNGAVGLFLFWFLMRLFISFLSSAQRRGQRQHRLQAPPQDEGGGHQRADSQAEVLLHLQDLQTATCLPLQPLRQLCGWVTTRTVSVWFSPFEFPSQTLSGLQNDEWSRLLREKIVRPEKTTTQTNSFLIGWCQGQVDQRQIHFKLKCVRGI